MAQKDQDSGLGLKEFLGGGAKEETSKQEVETKAPVVESKAVDKPVEAKAEAAKPAGLDKDTKEAKKVDKEPAIAGKSEVKPDGPNWDDDNNPWKVKASEFEKRYKDTHRWGNEVNQKFLDSQRQQQALASQLQRLEKKFDGTYDPQRDEPPPPNPEAIRTWGTVEGKAQASFAGAIRSRVQFGGKSQQEAHDEVMQALEQYAQIFGQDRGVQERILLSDHPVESAIEAVRAHAFAQKYGSDPDAILKKARAEWEANELPAHEARWRAEHLSNNKPEPKGIGKVQGSSGAMDSQIAKDNKGRPKPLSQLFGS